MKLPELKPGQHIVFYEFLYSIEDFNSIKDLEYKICDSKNTALEFIETLQKNYSFTNIIGPLTLS
jgi:hypothetical protein